MGVPGSSAAASVTAALVDDHSISAELLRVSIHEALSAHSRDVDLLIRPGGGKRLSDFLLWESAYAELLFTDRLWPDFDEADLEAALQEFGHRERRFGGVPTKSRYLPESQEDRGFHNVRRTQMPGESI